MGCDHSQRPLLVTTAGANSRKAGNFKSVKNAQLAYGIDWMTGYELKEAIPPAYSEYIARQFDLSTKSVVALKQRTGAAHLEETQIHDEIGDRDIGFLKLKLPQDS
jgi:hypothetical protein